MFGTYTLISVLSPSLRNVPFTGIEWSYQMKDMGFNERGELKRLVEDEEESFQLEEEKDENGHSDVIHRSSKVGDTTMDTINT